MLAMMAIDAVNYPNTCDEMSEVVLSEISAHTHTPFSRFVE